VTQSELYNWVFHTELAKVYLVLQNPHLYLKYAPVVTIQDTERQIPNKLLSEWFVIPRFV